MLVLALKFSRCRAAPDGDRPAGEGTLPQNGREDQSAVTDRVGRRTFDPHGTIRPTRQCTNVESTSDRRQVPTARTLHLLRKEVIQPHLPVRLPCYDFTPITDPTFDGSFLSVGPPASGVADFRGVTGGVYKARERIHPGVLIRDY